MLSYRIDNATLVDPSTGTAVLGSLGVADGRIAGRWTGEVTRPEAVRVVDGTGKLLLPGFIDVHTHTDNDLAVAERMLSQGVTTVLSGNCGFSPADLPAFFAERAGGYVLNQAEQIGHDTLRHAVGVDDLNAAASEAQIAQMVELAGEAFAQGAWGLSFGLEYDPGASEHEVAVLAKAAADAGRLVSIHTRGGFGDGCAGIREALDFGYKSGARVQISHLVYMYSGDELKLALELIEAARAAGVDVHCDSGMYTAWTTYCWSPSFDAETLEALGIAYDELFVCTGSHAGETLSPELLAKLRATEPTSTIVCDTGKPGDVETALLAPDVLLSTDCGKAKPGEGHPQAVASYPRFFRELVLDGGPLSLVEAARRTSWLGAQVLGLHEKGTLAAGADADLVLLDPATYNSAAGWPGRGDPDLRPTGVEWVWIGGKAAIEDGVRNDALLGRQLIR